MLDREETHSIFGALMAAEEKLETWTKKQIRAKKGQTRKIKWVSRRGAPDELVWIPAWSYPELWEMKAPGQPLEAHQKREHKRLKRMGLTCRKIDSKEQVLRLLQRSGGAYGQ